MHAGDHPGGIVIGGFHGGDVAAADGRDLVAAGLDETLRSAGVTEATLLRLPVFAASGAASSAAQLGRTCSAGATRGWRTPGRSATRAGLRIVSAASTPGDQREDRADDRCVVEAGVEGAEPRGSRRREMPARAGRTATASNPAVRATSLFTPDAIPDVLGRHGGQCRGRQRRDGRRQPEPDHDHGGEHGRQVVRRRDRRGSAATCRRRAMSGPTDICSRGPIRAASAPERADSSSISTVSGSRRHPRSERGVSRATVCNCTGTRNRNALSAPYIANVTLLAATNWLGRNSPSGSIGAVAATRAAGSRPAAALRPRAQITGTGGQCFAGPSMSPYVSAAERERPRRCRRPSPAGPGATCVTTFRDVAGADGQDGNGERQVQHEDPPPGADVRAASRRRTVRCALATPVSPDQAPMTRPRSSGGTRSAGSPGCRASAAPRPCPGVLGP